MAWSGSNRSATALTPDQPSSSPFFSNVETLRLVVDLVDVVDEMDTSGRTVSLPFLPACGLFGRTILDFASARAYTSKCRPNGT